MSEASRQQGTQNDWMIRHAHPADYPRVIAVLDQWWGGRRMADMLPKLFFVHFQPTSFVAERGGELLGFVVGFLSQTHPEKAYIHFVGVHPGLRGQALGQALYGRFFAAAWQVGARTVRCVTSPVNHGSIAFHQRMGFAMQPGDTVRDGLPVAADYDGPGEDRVLFSRSLAEIGGG